MALASVGIGLSGGIPLPTSGGKKDNIEINVESKDTEEEESQESELEKKG